MRNKTILSTVAVTTALIVAASPATAQAASGQYYGGDDTVQIVHNFLNAAAVGSVTCGINDVVGKMKKFKGRGGLPAIAAYSSQISAKTAGTSAACKLGKQMALAAAWTAAIGATGQEVWIEDLSYADSCGLVSRKEHVIYRIGPSPSRTAEFAGSVKVPCFA
ncbi:hypothetical protein OHA21_11190 [Actinoplanes sp. NBC_00393]|uniref:hypothetical protein n=1 Tax=Actinoplanes sp. NBC_00393 TaxID=2975953 RepID=UPI002E21B9F6